MQLSGGIFNRNLLAYQDDISKTIGREFNCFELQHIKAYKNDAIGLYTANNGDNTVSPNDTLYDPDSGLVICGEIRLYNREDLLNLLDDNNKLQTQNNHQLVLALFKKYSYQCVKHLNGDFAFVIWDENKQELFCARDQMGQRPFYYCLENEQFIFSTHLNGICMHQNLSKELDEIWVLDYLQKKISYTDKTVYKAIKRLPPAHYLIVNPDKTSLNRYWKLEDVAPNPAKTIEEAIAGLKTHIERAVSVRMQGTTKIGAELSGGLDSSAVASIAQHFSKPNHVGVNAYTNALAEDQKFAFENFVDEWEKAAEMARFAGIKNHFGITEPARPVLDLIQHEVDTIGYPTNFSFTALQLGIFLKSKEQGDEVLFSGFGGDELVTEGASGRYPFSLIKEKQYFKLLHFFQKQKGKLKGTLHALVFLRNYLRNKELKRNQAMGIARWESVLIKEELVNKYQLKESYVRDCYFPPNQTLKQRSLFRVYLPATTERLETGYALTNALGLIYTYPLLDVKLLEYYYSLPDAWKANPNFSRYLFRKAMQNYFPADILKQAKPTNTATIPFVKPMFENQMNTLQQAVSNLSEPIYRYLDKSKVTDFIEKDDQDKANFKFNTLKNSLQFGIFIKKD